jgi:hypothetical protein
MKKLRLDADALKVETFTTLPAHGEGTVAGREDTILFPIPITPFYCTNLEAYSCYEDCTTEGEDLSCAPTCESVTHYAPTCPHCDHDVQAPAIPADTV